MTWSEENYVAYLTAERRRYAWTLQHQGAYPPPQAEAEALARYPYEPPDAPYRGLIFHDEAWHWAMLHLHGENYWTTHPDLTDPPPAYETLD